ncbi:MAG: glutamine-hydrolyzing GMP synthase, partial [Bacteroidota bacterium]
MQDMILILDFGSQYTQLIARRVRELNVYCEIHPYHHMPPSLKGVKGIILSGSPYSVRDNESPRIDLDVFFGKVPLLGICYGAQYIAREKGGEVEASSTREYGRANLAFIDKQEQLLDSIGDNSQVWMSHADTITRIPESFRIVASSHDVNIAAYRDTETPTFGLQFHPEVYHSTDGLALLKNFVVDICKCPQTWTSASFVSSSVQALRDKIGNDKVVLGLSGGVDSSVAGVLLHQAIG